MSALAQADPGSASRKCEYCGRASDAGATHCRECGTRFSEEAEAAPGAAATPKPEIPPPNQGEEPQAGTWLARDAWKCLGMFVIFEVVAGAMYAAVRVAAPG